MNANHDKDRAEMEALLAKTNARLFPEGEPEDLDTVPRIVMTSASASPEHWLRDTFLVQVRESFGDTKIPEWTD